MNFISFPYLDQDLVERKNMVWLGFVGFFNLLFILIPWNNGQWLNNAQNTLISFTKRQFACDKQTMEDPRKYLLKFHVMGLEALINLQMLLH